MRADVAGSQLSWKIVSMPTAVFIMPWGNAVPAAAPKITAYRIICIFLRIGNTSQLN